MRVLQTTTDDRRQRPLLVWPPTLCVGGPVINVTACYKLTLKRGSEICSVKYPSWKIKERKLPDHMAAMFAMLRARGQVLFRRSANLILILFSAPAHNDDIVCADCDPSWAFSLFLRTGCVNILCCYIMDSYCTLRRWTVFTNEIPSVSICCMIMLHYICTSRRSVLRNTFYYMSLSS